MTKPTDLSVTSTFKITSADTDMKSRIRLGSYVNLLIQTAINHADHIGLSFSSLKEQKLFWVLSRLDVEIIRPLKWYEKADVETWPKCIHKLFYIRDFLVRDEKGEITAKATSAWLAIDLQTKRPKHIDGVHAELFTRNQDKHAIKELPIGLCDPINGERFKITPTYFDIDLNKHVTATRYIDWMVNSIHTELLLNIYPKKLSINYLKETELFDRIVLQKEEIAAKQFSFEGENTTKGKPAFRGRIEF